MRRPLIGLAVILGLSACATVGRAQTTTGSIYSDPFAFYYGFYLPRQAALSTQTTSQDLVNAQVANRVAAYNNRAERNALIDDIQPFGLDELDPSRPFGRQRSTGRSSENRPPAHFANAAAGPAPAQYFGGTSRYFPGMRSSGRGQNQSIPTTRGIANRGTSLSGAASGYTSRSSIGSYR